ncbi:MAG: sugar MFS transporter [Saprospiraceae bacterium]
MQNTANSRPPGYLYQLTIVGFLFFIFGFFTWLNGTLIPFLKLTCDLKEDWQALLVTSAFYLSYFFLALPSSAILRRTGFKGGMALGLLVMALGCLVFLPAANARAFPLFLIGLFVQGMGLALLQTAVNPYVSIIGPIESGAQRISIMGICNKAAGILSPIILSSILLRNATAIEKQVEAATDPMVKTALLDELAARVLLPYIVLAGVLMVVAFLIRRSALPDVDPSTEAASTENNSGLDTNRTSIFQFPHLLLGALAIFFYVGAEVMAGEVIVLYGKKLNFELDQTRFFTSFTLIAMLVGYVLSIVLIPKYVSQQKFLRYSALLGLALTLATYFASGSTAVTCIALLGLANAVMWPAIFPLAINGLGRFTQVGSALLIMGIIGGALLPPLYGLLADMEGVGYRAAFQITVVPCYLYILYYSVSGYKKR